MNARRARVQLLGLALVLVAGACTGAREATGDRASLAVDAPSDPNSALVTIPDVTEVTTAIGVAAPSRFAASSVAVIDDDGQLGLISDGVLRDEWIKFDAVPSPDRSTAVLTLGPAIVGIGPERPVVWVSLPDGRRRGEQMMRSDSELTATSMDGTFAGFTTRAGDPVDGAIAGSRSSSEIEIISPDDGTVYSQELDGNFAPEAFGGRLTAAGIPALVFLLEYFPADVPRFYRVRVLSTETGEVSLPLNLRDKQQQVDERMAGFTRSQIVAEEHGLLFTLYRGTIDGTPDGEPYAFVHTLDFADGVWCLEVDPRLDLDEQPGSLAVGGDTLYVASANGWVGSYPIPSIIDPQLSPSMDWVIEAGTRSDAAPVIAADDEAVYVVDVMRPGLLARLSPDGDVLSPTRMSGTADAFAWHEGALHAIGDDWATFDLDTRPGWLDQIAHLVVG